MYFFRYFILISLIVIAQSTTHAMHKHEQQRSSLYKKHLAWWGHTTSIYFFKTIRLIICGSQYGSGKLTRDDDAPYNIPTIEAPVYGWTTKKIKILKNSLSKQSRLT